MHFNLIMGNRLNYSNINININVTSITFSCGMELFFDETAYKANI